MRIQTSQDLAAAIERLQRREPAALARLRRPKGADYEHLRWLGHKRSRVGDRITVQIVRTNRADKHTDSSIAARNRTEAIERLRRAIKSKPKRRDVERRAGPR